jgi:hypothetical protein
MGLRRLHATSVGLLDSKTVVGAATGVRTLALKIPGSNISILHGELIGLILAPLTTGYALPP